MSFTSANDGGIVPFRQLLNDNNIFHIKVSQISTYPKTWSDNLVFVN